MKPNSQFINQPPEFWAYVKLISEACGYSKKKELITYTFDDVIKALNDKNLNFDINFINNVISYLNFRTYALNNFVKYKLQDEEEAKSLFLKYKFIAENNNILVQLPLNKQKGNKKNYAYFTCTINIITQLILNQYEPELSFTDDPRNLCYFTDSNDNVIGTFSRRFDGAFPNICNPLAIWEIKEYYYTTTFGSRIADGVYETQLDGHEILQLRLKGADISHYYFIDSYQTWWVQGKSYLCRIIDLLHMGLVDEVFFGKDIVDEWKNTLRNDVLTKLPYIREKEMFRILY